MVSSLGVNFNNVPDEVGQAVSPDGSNDPPLIVGGVIFLSVIPRVLATVHSVTASAKYFLPDDALHRLSRPGN